MNFRIFWKGFPLNIKKRPNGDGKFFSNPIWTNKVIHLTRQSPTNLYIYGISLRGHCCTVFLPFCCRFALTVFSSVRTRTLALFFLAPEFNMIRFHPKGKRINSGNNENQKYLNASLVQLQFDYKYIH